MDIFLVPLIIITILLAIIASHYLARVILRQKAEYHLKEYLRQDKDYQYVIRNIVFPYECISQIHLTTEKIIQLQNIFEQKLAALNEGERKHIIRNLHQASPREKLHYILKLHALCTGIGVVI